MAVRYRLKYDTFNKIAQLRKYVERDPNPNVR